MLDSPQEQKAIVCSGSYLISAASDRRKLYNVTESRLRNLLQRFFGEKSLVPGDEDVGKSQEAGEIIVGNDLHRKVLKKQFDFLLINIEAQIPNLSRFYCFDDRACVDEGPPARVYQHNTLFHPGYSVLINQMKRFRDKRRVQRDDVRAGHKLVQAYVPDSEVAAGLVGLNVISEQVTSKS